MSRYYKEYCYICGGKVSEDDGTYCSKHSDYSNRPDELRRKYCSWCGSYMDIDDSNDECSSCRDKEETVAARMYEKDQYYKGLSEDNCPETRWSNCSYCGLYTLQKRVYRRTDRFIDFVTLGATRESYETDEYSCENCGRHNS